MISKYDGFCMKCKKKIHKGDEIVKDEGLGKWVHKVCPSGKRINLKQELLGRNAPKPIEEENRNQSFSIEFTPSVYQEEIFKFIESGKGNGVIEAVAGSGKTTTIIKALARIPKDKKVAFFAFNVHIAKELEERLMKMGLSNVHVSTIHSFGLSICRKLPELKRGKNGIDRDKLSGLMDNWYPIHYEITTADRIKNRIKRNQLRKIVTLAKATLIDYKNREAVVEMMERYNIDQDDDTFELVQRLPELMQMCLDNLETVDFEDMQWLPVVINRLKLHTDKFDFVFIDEAQDLNACQIELLLNTVNESGRIIAVGDRKQSLYGFRGADTDAIPRLIEMLDAKTLPLSITYRCPKSHVERARKIVPQIEASDDAIDGYFGEIGYKDFLDKISDGDMVVCRTNAPLMKPAFQTIRNGNKAIIRGAEIGEQLVMFIQKFEAPSLLTLYALMSEYTAKEVDRLLSKGKELQAEMLVDKEETIKAIANECKTVEELTEKILILYSNDNIGVVFSSVHRAKGLEAQRVFVLRPELMPHPKAKQGWEMIQEDNTLYVALTRSKSELYYVIGE